MQSLADAPRRAQSRPRSSSVDAQVDTFEAWELEHRPTVAAHADSIEWNEFLAARERMLDELAEASVDEPDPVLMVLMQIDADHRARERRASDREFVESFRRWTLFLAPALPGAHAEACRAIAGALGQLLDRFDERGLESAAGVLATYPELAASAGRASA